MFKIIAINAMSSSSSSSSSSWCTDSMYSVDSLSHSSSIPIQQVLWMTFRMWTELMNVSFCLLTNTCVSMSKSPLKNLAYEFILTFSSSAPHVSLGWFVVSDHTAAVL